MRFSQQDVALVARFQTPTSNDIFLPKLRSLKLRNHIVPDYLDYIAAPVLTTLDIGFDQDNLRWAIHPHLHAFLERSNCHDTLHTLRITDTEFSPEELIAVILELPRLKHLILENVVVQWHRFFDGLENKYKAWRSHSGSGVGSAYPPVPPLNVLELHQISQKDAVLDSVFHFLYAREREPCQLIVSYESLPKIPDEARIQSTWEWIMEYNESPGNATRRDLGIHVSIVPLHLPMFRN
ncbi:hypothetical protein FA13DRAFT_1802548 [Coprinellus micaceus]|uniref:F-box domain-containing protein n=1 Tax=Coprinellus micaceus TaxID=71717 RepID=A0A4Y7SCR4_COPMI|nr:hypothetical protein FA13DRAFT_1802548 [Coprinellus micaceus]